MGIQLSVEINYLFLLKTSDSGIFILKKLPLLLKSLRMSIVIAYRLIFIQ